MSDVQPTTQSSTIPQEAFPTETLDDSLVAVLTLLSGKKYEVKNLENMKLSEEVLYAALVYDSLQKSSPKASKTFKEELKMRFDRRVSRNDSQPMAKAIQDILDNSVKAKALTKHAADKLVTSSLGHAQLDSKRSALSRTAKVGGFKKFEDTVSHNQNAKQKTVENFEKSVHRSEFLTPSLARHQRKELDKVFASVEGTTKKTPAKKPKTKETKTPTNDTATKSPSQAEKEKDIAAELPTLLDSPTGPQDFVYNPHSFVDGKPLVMIPNRYSDEIAAVSLIDDQQNEIEALKHTGKGSDGRHHFRGESSEEVLSSVTTVRLTLIDGTYVDEPISSGLKPSIKTYLI